MGAVSIAKLFLNYVHNIIETPLSAKPTEGLILRTLLRYNCADDTAPIIGELAPAGRLKGYLKSYKKERVYFPVLSLVG